MIDKYWQFLNRLITEHETISSIFLKAFIGAVMFILIDLVIGTVLIYTLLKL